MHKLLIFLACVASASAIALGTAGVIKLLCFGPQKKQSAIFSLFDYGVMGGMISMFQDFKRNWPKDTGARRLVYFGVGSAIICIILLLLALQIR